MKTQRKVDWVLLKCAQDRGGGTDTDTREEQVRCRRVQFFQTTCLETETSLFTQFRKVRDERQGAGNEGKKDGVQKLAVDLKVVGKRDEKGVRKHDAERR